MFGEIKPYVVDPVLKVLGRRSLARTSKLRDKFAGDECYIFGDGVSIKWMDLKKFSDKPAIILGLLPFHKDFRILNTVLAILVEPFWFYPGWFTDIMSPTSSMPKISKFYREQFILKRPDVQMVSHLSNMPLLRQKNISFVFRDLDFPELSDALSSRGIGFFGGSLRAGIALAIFMGFKKLTLIGCDYTHGITRVRHWYEKGEGVISSHKGYEKSFLEIAQQFCEIETVSLDNASDVIKSRVYGTRRGEVAKYSENSELLDTETMDVLRSWPSFSI